DLPLPKYLSYFLNRNMTASFLCIRPTQSFHVVSLQGDVVTDLEHISRANLWMNGGFFIFRQDIFRYLQDGEELVEQPFQRLIQKRQLLAYQYNGFWSCMDTFKDKQQLEDLYHSGQAPWEVWKSSQAANRLSSVYAETPVLPVV